MSRRTIERDVWPALAGQGFELRAPHAAWRHWHGGVDAVHVVWQRDDGVLLLVGAQCDAVPRRQRLGSGRAAPRAPALHVWRRYAPAPARADAIDRDLW